ncbi:MAG: Abi-alpha family protein [Solirubrobacteraceae bacterium]
MNDEPHSEPDPGVVDVLPGLARIAADAWLRTAIWGLEAWRRAGTRMARAATSPEEAARLAEDFGAGLRNYARELLGITDLDERVRQLMPPQTGPATSARGRRHEPAATLSLREQGAELLRDSADVNYEEGAHPAYERILTELAPDEGRILRLLATEGSQPAIDVRSSNLIGVGSQLVAPGLNMIGAQAGLRHVERVPAYLNNLNRLGLVWFSHEPIGDPMGYQVVEAQPEALDAIKQAGRAKTVHRSLRLTPFGQDFCEVCLPLDTAEIEALGG